MANMAGVGFAFNPTTQQIDFSIPALNLSTTQVSEGSRLYFTDERAQDAAAAAFVAGNAYNSGISFTYDDANNRITAVATGTQVPSTTGNAGKYLTVDNSGNPVWHNPPFNTNIDPLAMPSFTGNQGKYLTTDGTNIVWANIAVNTLNNGAYTLLLDSSGNVTASGDIKLPVGKDILRYNGSSYVSITGGLVSVSSDLNPQLGANLNLNGKSIYGTGTINVTGTIASSTGLGADLPLGGKDITGTGNINITGSVTATSMSLSSTLTVGSQSSIVGGPLSIAAATSFINTNPTTTPSMVNFLTTSSDALSATVSLAKSRGTVFTPSNVQTNDVLGQLGALGYTGASGTGFLPAGSIKFVAGSVITSSVLQSTCQISVNNSAGAQVTPITVRGGSVDFSVPAKVPSYTDTTARDAAVTSPSAGMIIFLSSTFKFQGYNGTSWVDFY